MQEQILLGETEIIELYFARDEAAISETDKCYGKALMLLSFRVLADREDSEENKSDTYFAAWRSIPPTRPRSLPAYLMKLCRNLALDRLDRHKARKRQAEVIALTDEMADCIPAGSVEAEVEARELGRTISRFIKGLSAQNRYILMARCFSMDSISEIASVLGCSEGKVRTDLYRLRMQLKDYLEKEF